MWLALATIRPNLFIKDWLLAGVLMVAERHLMSSTTTKLFVYLSSSMFMEMTICRLILISEQCGKNHNKRKLLHKTQNLLLSLISLPFYQYNNVVILFCYYLITVKFTNKSLSFSLSSACHHHYLH